METGLTQNKCLDEVVKSMAFPKCTMEETECGVPELRHFLYKNSSCSQVVYPAYMAPFTNKQSRQELFRRYQRVYSHFSGPKKLYSVSCCPFSLVYARSAECGADLLRDERHFQHFGLAETQRI